MNKLKHPDSLNCLLKRPGSHLDMLRMSAKLNRDRSYHVMRLLPNHLSQNCYCGALVEGVLTIFVPNASIASILRFEENNLLQRIKKTPLFSTIVKIKFKITPSSLEDNIVPTSKKRPLHPQPEIASLLFDTANLIKDKELKKSFQQLASRLLDIPEHD